MKKENVRKLTQGWAQLTRRDYRACRRSTQSCPNSILFSHTDPTAQRRPSRRGCCRSGQDQSNAGRWLDSPVGPHCPSSPFACTVWEIESWVSEWVSESFFLQWLLAFWIHFGVKSLVLLLQSQMPWWRSTWIDWGRRMGLPWLEETRGDGDDRTLVSFFDVGFCRFSKTRVSSMSFSLWVLLTMPWPRSLF